MDMIPSHSSKTVVISGGGTGIGLEIVRGYLSEGANVVLAGRRQDILEHSVEALTTADTEYKEQLLAVRADMSREQDVIHLFGQARDRFSAIHILINNAGMWIEKSLLQCTDEDIDSMFHNNLKSTILGTKIAASQLEEGGSVVNISSFAAVMAIHSASLYSTYKAALIQFTKSSASELAERDIRVNCIIPGVINTPMTADYISEHHDRLIKPIAMKRLGHPSEIASGVLFLTSAKASYITGDSIHITGGKYLTQL
jgi:NAD(P)-dependent dehydrogenase (short-subunit alcohol dehydrogenase family)